MFIESGTMKPRGGTTSGPEVQLDTRTSEVFAVCRQPASTYGARPPRHSCHGGDYRTSFDFIEMIGFTEGYRGALSKLGTERVMW